MKTHTTAALFFATLTCCLTIAGCGSSSRPTADQAIADYNAGRYPQAYDSAQRISRASYGEQREQMSYIAGISAYRMGDYDGAIDHLKFLVNSENTELAGRAQATLSLAYMAKRNNALALEHLNAAARKLSGNDRAQAYFQMGVIQQRLGQWSAARSSLILAQSNTADPALRRAIAKQLNRDGFTLQFGAYSSQAQANAFSRSIAPMIRAAYLVGPIVKAGAAPDGSTLYLVQAGRFNTQAKAEAARRRIGISDCFVAPTGSSR